MYWPPIIVLLTFLFATLSAIIALRFYWNNRKSEPIRLPRNVLGSGNHIFGQQLVVLAVIMLVGYFAGIDLYDLGLSQTFHPIPAFIIGFIVYFIVLSIIEALAAGFGLRERMHDLAFETMRLLWPRDPQQKVLAFIAVVLINPFTEEVIYRGVLVHQFGELIDNFWLAALIALVLSLAAHMYQGSWSFPFQMMFHAAAIGLLFSPMGLAACFGFHFAGDLVPVVTLKRSMIEWRKRKRSVRLIKS
jgi:membrane protease YdiL (CAAX protease family)